MFGNRKSQVSYNVRQYYKAKRATVFEAEGDGHLVQGEKEEEEEETEIQPLELLRPMKNMIAVSSFLHLSKVSDETCSILLPKIAK